MKPWQTSLNNTHGRRGQEGTKREDPSPSQKSKTQSDYHKFAEIIRLETGLKHCKTNYK
jgi:hypothetical protein